MRRYDVAIVGGGAAGLMCAIEAGKRGRRVLIIERSGQIGKKILISGGGRCNFTNLHVTPENFLSANPHFCKSALARYSPADFIAMVQRHGIGYHEKERGQLFCDLSAKLIVTMLADECRQVDARIDVNSVVTSVQQEGDGFTIETGGVPIHGQSLVIASGGLSIPKMGATNFGYELAKRFGHAIVPTRPALVPLTFGPDDLARYKELSGIGLPVEASCKGQSFSAPMLFTHRGLSGPAILQISSYWKLGEELRVNLLPDIDAAEWLVERHRSRPSAELKSVLGERLPQRLAQKLSERFANRPLRQYRLAELRHTAAQLQSWAFHPVGTEGYRTAEVTAGGVNTDELSSTTMESKKMPGLYIIGEVVDVTGHLGGFNFQWAWASGHAAGQVV